MLHSFADIGPTVFLEEAAGLFLVLAEYQDLCAGQGLTEWMVDLCFT